MRTIVDLPKEQLKLLATLCDRKKLSRAEIIRQAIHLYLKQEIHHSKTEAFGLWKNRSVDGLQYQNKCRAEWDA